MEKVKSVWLMKNDYKGLVKCMEEHPEKFAHIKQNETKNQKGSKIMNKETDYVRPENGKPINCVKCGNCITLPCQQ